MTMTIEDICRSLTLTGLLAVAACIPTGTPIGAIGEADDDEQSTMDGGDPTSEGDPTSDSTSEGDPTSDSDSTSEGDPTSDSVPQTTGDSDEEEELIAIPDAGAALDELLNDCTINMLLFDFKDGSGTTGPNLVVYPKRVVEGDSLVFEQAQVGAVGGRPYLYGVLILTLEGEDPNTGEWVIRGSINGSSQDLETELLMAPLRIDPDTLPDFHELIVTAEQEGVDPWDLISPADADFSGVVAGEPFAYDLRWYLGYDSFNGVGFPACDEKAGF